MVEPATSSARPAARAASRASRRGSGGGSGVSYLRLPVTVTRSPAIPRSARRRRSASPWTPKRCTGANRVASRRRSTGSRCSRAMRRKLASPTRALTTTTGRPRRRARTQHQRPVVALHQDQGAGRVAAVEARHREAEVVGQVGDGGSAGEQLAGAMLAGRGDGGDQQRLVRRQGGGEGRRDADLAHRHGVEPERRRLPAAGGRWRGRRQREGEPPGKRCQVVDAAPGQQERSRQQHQEREQGLVEEPHGRIGWTRRRRRAVVRACGSIIAAPRSPARPSARAGSRPRRRRGRQGDGARRGRRLDGATPGS